jgi:hypothetical protein
MMERFCLVCRKPLKGRSDKKFCDDQCRNRYNNELKSGRNLYVRHVNKILKKNRRILEELLPATKRTNKIGKDKLQRLGFYTNFYTHTYTDKKGNTYHFCYEYGYLLLENDQYILVKRKDDQKTPITTMDVLLDELH